MTTDAAHRSLWCTANLFFGISLVLGFALNYYHPLNFGQLMGLTRGSIVLHLIGAPFLVIGGLVVVYAKQTLHHHDQPSEPGVATTTMVQSGSSVTQETHSILDWHSATAASHSPSTTSGC